MSKLHFTFFIILLFIFLFFRFYIFYHNQPKYLDKQAIAVTTRIVSEPYIAGKSQRLTISLASGQKVYVTTNTFPFYKYGQAIQLNGKLQKSEKEGRVFLTLSYPHINLVNDQSNFVIKAALAFRNFAVSFFTSHLSTIDAGLLLGIVFGIKLQLPVTFQEQLRNAGVMHVIAASGMNVSLVAGALYFLLQRFFQRKVALAVSLLGVIFYMFIAGLEPSIIRAAIMAGMTFSAGMLGRQKISLYILFFTGIVMLLIQPPLLFDVGFQLSFLATAGIMQIKPLFSFFERGKLGAFIGEDFTTTLAAQIATLPIILSNFGSVNILSLLVNVLVLWTIPVIMVLGGIAVIAGYFFQPLAIILIYLCLPLIWYFKLVISFFHSISIPLQLEAVPFSLWAGYYLVIVAIIIFKKQQDSAKV